MPWGQIWPHPGDHKFYMGLQRENFRNFPVPSHKAYGYQILHVTLSSVPSVRDLNYSPKVELIARITSFSLVYFVKYFEIFLLELMATNFSPSSGSYVLNKFPSISQWSDTGPSWPSCSTVPQDAMSINILHLIKIIKHVFNLLHVRRVQYLPLGRVSRFFTLFIYPVKTTCSARVQI